MKLLLALALLVVITVSGCTSQPLVLDSVEVQNYSGEDLSSINDFRENSIKGPQYIDIETYTLTVGGLVEDPQELTYQEVLEGFQSYSKVVTLDCVEGWSATILWEGFLVRDLLEQAQPTQEANTIIFHAYDGYTTSFPLKYITGNEKDIIIAYRMNDVTIPPERGYPFQLVSEDKWGYKWIKWITRIELSDDEDYRGFWESRGYSNTADLDEFYFGD